MDLHSFISLKEAYSQVGKPQQLTESVDSIWEEVEAFAHTLVEDHDFDLSEKTWDEVREAYSECSGELLEFIKWGGGGGSAEPDAAAIAAGKKREAERRAAIAKKSKEERTAAKTAPASKDNYAGGVVGQFQRLGDKMSGNQNRATKAKEYETSVNNIRTRMTNAGTGTRNSKVSQNDIDAETKGRAAQTASGNKPADKSGDKKPSYKGPGGNPNGSGQGQAQQRSAGTGARSASSSSKPVQKAAPAAPKSTAPKPAASKADRMGAWAKANPKLAAAKAKRDSTRGTSATTNPLMNDLKKRMPKPAAPAKAPVAKATAAKPADSSQMRAMSKPAATKPAATKPVAAKPVAPKPVAAKRPMLSKAAPKTGAAASSALNKFASKPMKEESEFDLILAHLIEQGFGDDEALKIMVNMPEETRIEILALSEEESDKMKDKHLESGGHSARTDYSKTPAANTWGKKKMTADEREAARKSAFSKVVGDLKKKHGDKAIRARSSDD